MNTRSANLDRFVHALISPLTALQGAIGLLRRGHAAEDQRTQMLLSAIERSTERLRAICEELTQHIELTDELIRIELPLSALEGLRPASQPAAALEQQVDAAPPEHAPPPSAGGTLLLVAQEALLPPDLPQKLLAHGHQLLWADSTADGIDQARQIRPELIVFDPRLDAQAYLAAEILNEDPETKMIPRVELHEQIASPELDTLVGQIEAGLAAGRGQRRVRSHILIVDDEPDIAQLIAAQFAAEGYLTSEIGSGAEALRVVREQQFDLILLDVLLPDLDGFTVLGGLRAQPETQLTPIILLSAINSPADKVRGLQLGADDYITKPFSDVELNARVQAAMRRSEREGGANPSTRLPGNVAIERAINRRIEQGEQAFAVCYCDIDNFKAYNDSYGFLKGDAVIQRTAQILLDTVREYGNADDFVGHIGGDDFVVITSLDRLGPVCRHVLSRFDATAPLFYDREARLSGYISGQDRQGRPTRFPIVSLSVVAVSTRLRPVSHPGEVAQRSVELKKRAKLIPGSVCLVDE